MRHAAHRTSRNPAILLVRSAIVRLRCGEIRYWRRRVALAADGASVYQPKHATDHVGAGRDNRAKFLAVDELGRPGSRWPASRAISSTGTPPET